MRKLHSVHDIANSPEMIWDQSNAFVAYLLVGRQDARYRKHVERYWTDYDLMTGDYLYVVVTALLPERRDEENQEEILTTEHEVTKELLSKFGLTFDNLPCLLFMEGPESKRYFCYELKRGALDDESIAQRFRKVFSACDLHWPGYGNARSESSFSALYQTLRAQKGREFLGPIVGDLTPKFLLSIIKKLVGV
ncbi:hypothetical protein [Dinoroseobacter sp. S76]|uniref:hypothetical protein n=1 Tax=Dinoroseobacter sp. S76 TaxID=3415124 RepID=UPI003C7CE7FC